MKSYILKHLKFTLFAVLFSLVAGKSAVANDLVKYAVCDIEVLYLYDDVKDIDWPTIYYLNENFGCRVDLLTLQERTDFNITTYVTEYT